MAGDVQAQETGSDQLADDRAPRFLVEITTHPVGRQAVMAQGPDFLGIGATQHVDHMGGTEPLPGAIDHA